MIDSRTYRRPYCRYEAHSTLIGADFLRPEIWEQTYYTRCEETICHPQADKLLEKGY